MPGSLTAMVAQIFNAAAGSTAMRYVTHPDDLAGIAVADDAAWDQIIASTVMTQGFHHLAGIGAYHFGVGADVEEQVEEGVGGADGATTAAGVTLVKMALGVDYASGVGAMNFNPWMLPVPLRVESASPGTTDRHAMRISTSATGGQALVASINLITGMGT